MEYKEFINSIEEGRLTYRGRAMAFYEDGKDFGIVTVLSAKTSHHLVTSHAHFIYSEANHELVGTTNTGGHIGQGLYDIQTASCGRKYILTCDSKDGHLIYVGDYF